MKVRYVFEWDDTLVLVVATAAEIDRIGAEMVASYRQEDEAC